MPMSTENTARQSTTIVRALSPQVLDRLGNPAESREATVEARTGPRRRVPLRTKAAGRVRTGEKQRTTLDARVSGVTGLEHRSYTLEGLLCTT